MGESRLRLSPIAHKWVHEMRLAKKLIFGLLYVVVSVAFVVAFGYLLSELRERGRWSVILFPLVISVIFSFDYLKKLFSQRRQRITVRLPNLIVALLLFVSLNIGRVADILFSLNFVNTVFLSPYGQPVAYFLIWFNLIRAFKRQDFDAEIEEMFGE